MKKIMIVSGFLAILLSFFIMYDHSETIDYGGSIINNVHWKAFFPAAFLMAAIPGANQILSFRNGLRKGTKSAVTAVSGRFTAFIFMVVAVAFGLGTILESSAVLFNIVKCVGVAYLVWLGLRTLLTSRGEYVDDKQKNQSHEEAPGPNESIKAWQLIRQEFMVAASNPKAYLLFAVFLPQFIDIKASGAAPQILLVGVLYIAVEFCCAYGYAMVGGRLRILGITARVKRLLDRITGTAMIGLAVWIASEKGE